MMMTQDDRNPIEKKSSKGTWFVLGVLFFLVFLWAIYDAMFVRPSWKGYQRAFNQLELGKIQEEYEKAKRAFNAEDDRLDRLREPVADESEISLRRIRLKVEAAEVRLEGGEFRRLERKLRERRYRLADAGQQLEFTKGRLEEIYYKRKHASSSGEEVAGLKKEYSDLERKIAELEKEVATKEAEEAELQRQADDYYVEVKKWKDAERKRLEPLASLETRMKGIRSRRPEIRQRVIADLGDGGTVDRCESCHVAIDRVGFEDQKNPFKTHPFREQILVKHPIENFGCTTCHGGQGRATRIKGMPLGPGDFVHGFVPHWTDPLLRGDFIQSSCIKCHEDQRRFEKASVAMAGKRLFLDRGCSGCHILKGSETAPKVAPSLRKIANKVYPEWMVSWIKNPRGYLPHAKMPRFSFGIDEEGKVEKIVSYLIGSSEPDELPFGSDLEGNQEEGKRICETVGCLGCHTLGNQGGEFAPPLDRIASKTTANWIYNWVQDPKHFNSETQMPSLNLSSREAADLTAYLMQQGEGPQRDETLRERLKDPENEKKGFQLISQYGCYGCHEIKGFENAPGPCMELTAIGKKKVRDFDYGDTKVPRTWRNWVSGKLRDPRMYQTERTTARMPNFDLSWEQVHSLTVFLRGFKEEKVPQRLIP